MILHILRHAYLGPDLAAGQPLDVREHLGLLVLQMPTDLVAIVVVELTQHLGLHAVARLQHIVHAAPDAGDYGIEPVTVRRAQIPHQMRQIGRRERRRVGFVIGAGVHTAYHEKQCARHVVTTAHLADRYVAERQLDVEAQKNRQKAVIGIYQLYDLHILREDRSIGSVTFHFPFAFYIPSHTPAR